MLPTFIIGLREGLEAALIVGIVAAFLGQQGRTDALRQVWVGTAAAVVLCLAFGIGLDVVSRDLPQRQQEGLETVIGLIAVGFVTYMVLWMRRHARDLKGELEGHAASALASGSARALVLMAFLAVLREGFETAVFLLATFQNSTNPAAGGIGALLGVGVAVVIGFLIYRGGLRIDLGRFFRVTGVVLVVIAAGLVMSAFHTAHEAGLITFGQAKTVDLAWLVRPGTPVESLATGVLGIRQEPVLIEVVAYLAYLIPMLALVLAGSRRNRTVADEKPERTVTAGRAAGLLVVAAALGAVVTSCAKSDDATASKGAIRVVLSDRGCRPSPAKAPSGRVQFSLRNDGSAKVTEAELKSGDGGTILGERENLTDGLTASFALNLRAGTYKVVCPGAAQDTWDFTVTSGEKVANWKDDPRLVQAVSGYATYVDEQARQLATATTSFTNAVRAGNVALAQRLYGPARVPYERIEPVAESFGSLDAKIDGRADDGVAPTALTGFHRLEYALWIQHSLTAMGPVADELDANVAALGRLVERKGRDYVPEEITNGATELMNEVLTGKLPGEEERYSHTDLIDFQANLDGTMHAVDLVRPVLRQRAPRLLARIDTQAAAAQRGLDRFKATPGHVGSGFVVWGYVEDADPGVSPAQRRALADAVKPLAESLSEVPVQVVAR